MPTKPYNKHTLMVMLKNKKNRIISKHEIRLEQCKRTLKYYVRSKLIGCDMYYVIKSDYSQAHSRLLKLKG